MPKSPINSGETKLVDTISVARIVELYKSIYDVSRFFSGVSTIEIYECVATGYRFYQPFGIDGDGPFYEALAHEELYYVPWKSEHEIADSYIKEGDRVLELGCATGDFLQEEHAKKSIQAFGTELNETAKATASARGVSFEPVTDADVTCAFQVLEHIADVRGFLTEATTATREGGYIIIGVPNNDSLLKDDTIAFLNMPPHHMGLWNARSLSSLPEHFPLELVKLHTETLQPNHYRWYYQVYFGDKLRRFGFIGKVLNKLIFTLIARPYISFKAKGILGHTIVAVYKKRAVLQYA